MGSVKSYRDLEVWKRAVDWAVKTYMASRHFPPDERFGLTSQLRRAAVSVASNIAGGAARTGPGEYLHGISIANGSLAEAETQLVLATRLGMLTTAEMNALLREAETISKMLAGLKRSLQSKPRSR